MSRVIRGREGLRPAGGWLRFAAAKREAFEEAGISNVERMIQLDSTCTVPANVFKEWKNWPKGTYVVKEMSFAVQVETPVVAISEEHSEYKWCSIEEAMELLKWDSNKTSLWELSQRLI